MCPATPSSKPYLPKMRKAAARRPLRYSRSSCLSVKVGGLHGVVLVGGDEGGDSGGSGCGRLLLTEGMRSFCLGRYSS